MKKSSLTIIVLSLTYDVEWHGFNNLYTVILFVCFDIICHVIMH